MGFDQYWLLTWTTYGQWLPGDPRGSVTRVRTAPGKPRIEHDQFQTPYDGPMPELQRAARNAMKSDPVWLTRPQAELLLEQFQETAAYRRWGLAAVAIMANHVHLVVGAPAGVTWDSLLRDFKSYGSRKLNAQPEPANKPHTWWTQSGSRRRLPDEQGVRHAIEYVRQQSHPLVIHILERLDVSPPSE
ncbi:MAG: transposase [Planctomycetaceae bacterium]